MHNWVLSGLFLFNKQELLVKGDFFLSAINISHGSSTHSLLRNLPVVPHCSPVRTWTPSLVFRAVHGLATFLARHSPVLVWPAQQPGQKPTLPQTCLESLLALPPMPFSFIFFKILSSSQPSKPIRNTISPVRSQCFLLSPFSFLSLWHLSQSHVLIICKCVSALLFDWKFTP